MPAPITQELGAFLAARRFDQVPPEVTQIAKRGFADCLAVMLAGRREAATQTVRKVLLSGGIIDWQAPVATAICMDTHSYTSEE